MKTQSLNGQWQGLGRGPDDQMLSFTGRVPGCVHTDLLREGIINDPFWRDNAESMQWIENWSWQYTKTFNADWLDNVWLKFEGLDTYCDIYLNGRLLGHCENMFLSYRFAVSGYLKPEENELKVIFYSPIAMTAGKPPREGAFTTERLYTRRMQCTYYWDWVARFVTCGIWKEVRLCREEKTELQNVYLYTRHLDSHGAQIGMHAALTAAAPDCTLHIAILDPDGKTAIEKDRLTAERKIFETFDIFNPQLWYPNGYGEPKLYTVKLSVTQGETLLCQKQIPFGIRTVRLLQKPDEPGSAYHRMCLELKKGAHVSGENAKWDRNEKFSGFCVLVNDIPIFCKGANWVPHEPFPSEESREKTEYLLKTARDAGMNMVRVWGGGIFEHDWFYDCCDRLGLLVTQDFLMACGSYPDQEEWFKQALRQEAEHAALRLRNHACLAWWSGDNENAVEGDDNLAAYPGRTVVRGVIEPVVHKLDPMRDFLPSSPYNGIPYGSITVGTTHNTQFIGDKFSYIRFHDMQDYRAFFAQFLARFVAEEPSMGAPMFCSLRKFMTEEDIFGDDLSMWRYHTKNNPAEYFKTFELFDYLQAIAEKVLGKFTGSEDRVVKMQYVQYEWVRVTIELFRRNKGFSWGLLFWMLNDCWPSSGWSLIDYYGVPKAAYYAFKRAAQGVIASIDKQDGAYRIHICNDTITPVFGSGSLRLVNLDGDMTEWTFSYQVDANASAQVFSIRAEYAEAACMQNALLVCDIEGDRAIFMERSPAYLKLPTPAVRMTRTDKTHLVVHADTYAHAVMLDGEYCFSDNCFTMLPGETRKITCTPSLHAQSDGIELRVLK